MEKKCIFSENGAPAQGPYSHAVQVGNTLYVSGQISVDRGGKGVLNGTIEEETHQVLSNLKVILEDAGSSMAHVVKTTCLLADINDFAAFNAVYAEYFTENQPARTTFEVGLTKGLKVEVDAIAIVP